MAMPSLAERYWTPDDVRALPDDGQRYECIDGELLVTPSPVPPHQLVLMRFVESLLPYVRAARIGEFLTSPADIEIEPGSLVQPDLLVAVLHQPGTFLRTWAQVRTLALAVEILSPSTARNDRVKKRAFFQRAGVEEYWVVDLYARVVERWRPGIDRPEVISEVLRWHPTGASGPLEIDLPALFRAALGEP
jgi:Uma2 family endonuclease